MPYLLESDLPAEPLTQFDKWYREAEASGAPLWDAMVLATASAAGRPSARMVLLKGFDQDGFVFFTNYQSRKSIELAQNPVGCLLFWWAAMDRQIRIEGDVTLLSEQDSDTYFSTRPRGSQLGAWASDQSRVVRDRASLDRRMEELEKKYGSGAVQRPPHWGGYRLRPQLFEFWQGQPNRLHDRLQYRRSAEGWLIERLAP
jgi:pyridoxamine 5'-phosphate oxidase